jgi:hypothetical protein
MLAARGSGTTDAAASVGSQNFVRQQDASVRWRRTSEEKASRPRQSI